MFSLGSFLISKISFTGKWFSLKCLTLPSLTVRTSQASSATIYLFSFTKTIYIFHLNAAHKLLSIFMLKFIPLLTIFFHLCNELFNLYPRLNHGFLASGQFIVLDLSPSLQ